MHCFDKLISTPRIASGTPAGSGGEQTSSPMGECSGRENEPADERCVHDVEEDADFFCQSHVCHNENEDLNTRRKGHAIANPVSEQLERKIASTARGSNTNRGG